ncbi:MAG: amidohydrolase family protein [Clostridiaceae bacterium]|nr:amidohydrolase family protein [Clostridiaceae bacterium]
MKTLAEKALQGEPLDDITIIDAHNHIGCWSAFYVPGGGTIEQMIRRADCLGIDKLCITAHASIGPDYVYGNDMVFDAIQKYPDRVIGYVTVNPNYPEDMRHELDRCFSRPGFRAIKLHPGCHSREVDYRTYAPAYELANERSLTILIHTWGRADVVAVDRLASRYPRANFIIAHMGGDQLVMEQSLDIINSHDNVYGDLAISTPQESNVEYFVQTAGSKKIIFGTDMPFYDPSFTLARTAAAQIPLEAKKDIFAGNISRLLGRIPEL